MSENNTTIGSGRMDLTLTDPASSQIIASRKNIKFFVQDDGIKFRRPSSNKDVSLFDLVRTLSKRADLAVAGTGSVTFDVLPAPLNGELKVKLTSYTSSKFTLQVTGEGPFDLEAHVALKNLGLQFSESADNTFTVGGEVTADLFGNDVPLSVELTSPPALSFGYTEESGALEPLQVNGLGTLDLTSLTVGVKDSQWDVSTIGTITIDDVPPPFNGPFEEPNIVHETEYTKITVSEEGPVEVVPNFSLENCQLVWRKTAKERWRPTGGVTAILFGQAFDLKAKFPKVDDDRILSFTYSPKTETGLTLDGLGTIALSSLTLRAKQDDLSQWDIDVGGTLTFDVLPAPLDGPFAVAMALKEGQLWLSISETETFDLVENLSLSNVRLEFTLGQDEWSARGSVCATIFDKTLDELYAQFVEAETARTFTLGWTSDDPEPLVSIQSVGSIESVGSLDVSSLEIAVARSTEDGYTWSLASTGHLEIPDVFTLGGSLELYKETDEMGIFFAPEDIAHEHKFELPLVADDGNSKLTIGLSLERIGILREGGTNWVFEATTNLTLDGFGKDVQDAIPRPIEVAFRADSSGVELTLDRLVEPIGIPLPSVSFGGREIELGTISFEVTNFHTALGKSLALGAELTAHLPPELNNIFGSENGQPNYTFFTEEVRLALGISKDKGLYLNLLSSLLPPEIGRVEKEGDVAWQHIDLGEFGQIRMPLPTFSFDGRGFAASGAFEIVEPLALPLTPIKSLFEAYDLSAIADVLPNKIPLTEFNVLDANGDLDVTAFLDLIQASDIAEDVSFPIDEFGQALELIAGRFNQLPDAFQEYLSFELPAEFEFEIIVTPDGGVRFDIRAEDEPVKTLRPFITPGIPVPGLIGLKLNRAAFGEILSGSLFILDLDAVVDYFDLPTLVASLALPEEASRLLPDTRDLHRRFIVRDLFMIIIYQAGIPIPIPLFYSDLGFEYLGLEGLGLGLKWQFPMPQADFADIIQVFMDMEKFFVDREYLLPENFFADHDLALRFGIDPAYIQLPKYASGDPPKLLGSREQVWSTDLTEVFVEVLNTVKKPSLGRLVRMVPLEARTGSGEITFGPMTFNANWAIATDQEFRGVFVDYTKGKKTKGKGTKGKATKGKKPAFIRQLETLPAAERSELLDIIKFDPNRVATAQDDGAIALLMGGWSLDNLVAFNVRLGLAQSASMGYGFGFAIAGDIADLMDFEARGGILINVENRHHPVLLSGHSHLDILEHRIFNGNIQLAGDRFYLNGQLALFPPTSPFQVGGQGLIEINNAGRVDLLTDVDVSLRDFTLFGSQLEITNNSIVLNGTWLGVDAGFSLVKRERDFVFQGDVDFDFTFDLNLGPIYEPLTGLKVIDKLPLGNTGLSASLDTELGTAGFMAAVTSGFQWQGDTLAIPRFTLYVPPLHRSALLDQLIEEIKANASEIFAIAYQNMADWLKAAVEGTVVLAREFAPLVDAARKWVENAGEAVWDYIAEWSPGAWEAMRWWSKEAWEATKEWTAEAWQATAQWSAAAWQATTQWTADAWEATKKWTADAWNATKEWTAAAWNATTQWTADAWEATTHWTADAWEATTHWTAAAWNATTQWTADAWNSISQWSKEAWAATKAWTSAVWEVTTQWSKEAWEAIREWTAQIWNVTKEWTADAWRATTEWTKEAWDCIKEWGIEAWQATTQWSAVAWNATTQWTADAWKATTQWPTEAWKATTQWPTEAWKATEDWSKDAWEATKAWTAEAWNATTQWPTEAWKATEDWSKDAWEATKAWTAEAWNATTQWSTDAWNATTQWPTEAWKATEDWSKDAWEATKAWTSDAWNATTQWPIEAWEVTKQWTNWAWEATKEWPIEVWQATTDWTANVWEDTGEWQKERWQDIERLSQTVIREIEDRATEAVDLVQETATEFVGKADEFVDTAWNTVKDTATNTAAAVADGVTGLFADDGELNPSNW
jgi:ElaB/YqjD/DUF883 family membrane-anchored ribosome-binding protein